MYAQRVFFNSYTLGRIHYTRSTNPKLSHGSTTRDTFMVASRVRAARHLTWTRPSVPGWSLPWLEADDNLDFARAVERGMENKRARERDGVKEGPGMPIMKGWP